MNISSKIKILIADDHHLVREGIIARIGMSENMEVCGEASDGNEAVAKSIKLQPDIVFLDISMPGATGLEAAQQILAQRPETRIIFLSVYDNPEYIQEALRIGAKGYLLKDISREEMAAAVHAIYNGGTFLGSRVTKSAFDGPGEHVRAKKSQYKLSERETEVLAEIAKGSTNKEIAKRLDISVRTVESHRLAIREKTGGGNAAALFRIANELGLV